MDLQWTFSCVRLVFPDTFRVASVVKTQPVFERRTILQLEAEGAPTRAIEL
jgi:hypothetical protein